MTDTLKKIRANIQALYELIESLHSSYEVERSVLCLKEAKMELGRVLHELGSTTPYRHSKNPSNDILIDTEELHGSPAIDNAEISHVRLVKGYRRRIDQIESDIKEIISTASDIDNIWIIEHLKEATKLVIRSGMWLGVELGRVKDERDSMY
ncbi:MAG: hypothetical protein AB8G11_08735 [Saprospiraceae bacterium]